MARTGADIGRHGLDWHGHYYPRRYWNAFIAGSLITHLLIIAVFYNASLSALLDMARQETPQMLYVGLAEPERPAQPAVDTGEAVPHVPEVTRTNEPSPVHAAAANAPAAPRGEAMRSPAVKKEDVSDEDLQAAIPVPADREGGVTVAIRGAEKTASAATAQPAAPRVGPQTRAVTPGTAKGVAKGDRQTEARTREFGLFSTAGKPLDIPGSPLAKQETSEPGDDPSARWFQPKDLSRGGGKLQAGTENGPAGKARPMLTTVTKAGPVAGAAPGDYGSAAAPVSKQPGPGSHTPPGATRMIYGPAPRPGRPGSAAQSAAATAVPSGLPHGPGAEKQLALAGGGRAGGPGGAQSSEPRIGPRPLVVASQPAPVPVPPSVTITSPVEGSELDAYREKTVTIAGTARGRGVSLVRVHFNGGDYEAPIVDGKFTLKARIDTEENVVSAEVTDDSGGTAKSKAVKFRAANLFPKDMVVKVEYKGEGAHPVLDCRFRPHPLAEKRRSGAVPPKFHVEDGAARGTAEVSNAPAGIYSIGATCGPGKGVVVDAVFEVTLYGYDQGRKKTRRIGPVRLATGVRAAPVRVLLPEGVFWDEDDWFTGVVEGGNGTLKYKEPEGLVWKEQER